MDLLAISYQNIGPFKDRLLSIFFDQGKYLIKAPIGSGKSFLFFDGPSYALYKAASRNLLNNQSKTGFIKLIFKINESYYLIKRYLKAGKVKDSCSSQLFSLDEDQVQNWISQHPHTNILCPDIDIEQQLIAAGVRMEEIVYKNESDLQQQMQELLPPQRVFVSTIFLLQDADNIFEMQPAQRLEVLKNVFWLLDIDESKDIVKEKRNEVKYQIRTYQDTSPFTSKLQHQLKRLIQLFRSLQDIADFKEILSPAEENIQEFELLIDKLGIQGFSLSEGLKSFVPQLKELSSKKILEHQQKKTEQLLLSQQREEGKNKIQSQENQVRNYQQRLAELERLLSSYTPEQLNQLRAKKKEALEAQGLLEQSPLLTLLKDFYQQQQEALQLPLYQDFTLSSCARIINELISKGKHLSTEIQLLEQKIQQIDQQQKQQIQQAQSSLDQLRKEAIFYQQQLKTLEENIRNAEQREEQEATFACEKIGTNCPFIRVINKQHFEQREVERARLLHEKSQLLEKYWKENIDLKINEAELQLKKNESGENTLEQQQSILKEKTAKESQLTTLKSFFQKIDHQQILQLNQEREEKNRGILHLDTAIQQQEQLLSSAESQQKEKIQIQTSLEHGKKEILLLSQQQEALQIKIQALEQSLLAEDIHVYQKAESLLQDYLQSYEILSTLLEEFSQLQKEVKILSEKEKKLADLYSILNKELLLFVLGEYLPTLSDIINNYLSDIVDYQIIIRLKETSEQLELEAKIEDAQGERDIKSLSGGQRTILKLVWMLAISQYLKTKILFLDETVNNLDQETVGKVAELLNNFVKQRTMKFYTITHNSEIQAMDIWDSVIEVW